MGKRVAFALACAACFLVYPSAAQARLARNWNYDDLLKEADLVVIAKAVRTEQADDEPPEHSWPRELVAKNTTLKVSLALKGKAEGAHIKVLHFKFGEYKKGGDPERAAILGVVPPQIVTFRTGPVTVGTGKSKRIVTPVPEYLLFLKKTKDGRYEPLSGHFDPDRSIREVSKVPGSDY